MRVDRSSETGKIVLSQAAYTRALLRRFNMNDSRPISTPKIMNDSQTQPQPTENLQKESPDITVAVNQAARKCNNPSITDIVTVKRIMRYLAGTLNYGIAFTRNYVLPALTSYVDADWSSEKLDRKSIYGFVMFLNGPVAWGAVKQSCVALSTAEAEYVALSRATTDFSGSVKCYQKSDSHKLPRPS